MKKFIFIAILFSNSIMANDAIIRFGLAPMYGKVMKVIAKNRISGSIRDLEVFGSGEDEDLMLSCYEGSAKDVCGLLNIALKEENDKSNRSKKDEFSLKRCDLNNYGNIIISIQSNDHESISLSFGGMPPCSRMIH